MGAYGEGQTATSLLHASNFHPWPHTGFRSHCHLVQSCSQSAFSSLRSPPATPAPGICCTSRPLPSVQEAVKLTLGRGQLASPAQESEDGLSLNGRQTGRKNSGCSPDGSRQPLYV